MKKRLFIGLICFFAGIVSVAAQNKAGTEIGQKKPLQSQAQSSEESTQKDQLSSSLNRVELSRELKQFTITQDETDKIMEMVKKDTQALELARAEIKEMQAKLSRLLLEEKPNRAEIEKTVRQSVEAEYRIRMIQIERSLSLRETLGQDRWAIVIRVMRLLKNAELTREDIKELVKLGVSAETLKTITGIIKTIQ